MRRRLPIGLARTLGGYGLAASLLAAMPGPAEAQSELSPLSPLLRPDVGHVEVRSDYRVTLFPDEGVSGQPTTLGYTQHDFSLSGPLGQDSRDEWTGSATLRSEIFSTHAVLPDTREPFPDELWNVRFGTTYRHVFDNGWTGGGNVTLGSASDQPFDGWREMTVGATAFVRVPQGERNAWLFLLNYSNTREFLPNVPLPGVAFLYAPSDEFRAVLGVPLAVFFRPREDVTLELLYAPLTNVHARATYRLLRSIRLYAGYDWSHESYFRAARQKDSDQLFYYDQRVTAGIGVEPLRWLTIDVTGGYAFDRFYFEGQDFSDRNHNRIDVGTGPFVGLRAEIRF